MVYVLDKNGQPLMPTDRHRKVRLMLQSGQAKVIKRCPFTIQLIMIPDIKHRKFLLELMPEANISEYRQPQKSKCYMRQM